MTYDVCLARVLSFTVALHERKANLLSLGARQNAGVLTLKLREPLLVDTNVGMTLKEEGEC